MIIRLALIGFGNVGQEFARLLLKKREWLLKRKGLDVEVLAISTKTKGSLLSKKALDLGRILQELETRGTLRDFGPEAVSLAPLEILNKCDADVMVELTPLNVVDGEPAIGHIKEAFDLGMDVITANKGPLALAYHDLRDLARSRGVHFRFEGTVMDGTPIFNLVEKTLPGCEVTGLRGILNSTSNFVLARMAGGLTLDQAVSEAQARGFAEADPSMDIDGWDAAAKITALANVLMDAGLTPKDVVREGIGGITASDLESAKKDGKKIKQVAEARISGDGIALSVKVEHIGPDSPYWSVDGTSSALTIMTDLMGDVTVIEENPTVVQTAYAVLSDLLLTVDSIRTGSL